MVSEITHERAREIVERAAAKANAAVDTTRVSWSARDPGVLRAKAFFTGQYRQDNMWRAVRGVYGVEIPPKCLQWQMAWLLAHLTDLATSLRTAGVEIAEDEDEEDEEDDEPDEGITEVPEAELSPNRELSFSPPTKRMAKEQPGFHQAQVPVTASGPSGFGGRRLLDPDAWVVRSESERDGLVTAWETRLKEAGVKGAQWREAGFLLKLVSLYAAALGSKPDEVSRQAAQMVVARLETLRLGAQEGWARASAFYANFFGEQLEPEAVEEVPEFLRPAVAATAGIQRRSQPPSTERSTSSATPGPFPDFAIPGGRQTARPSQGQAARRTLCFRCGGPGHYANQCPRGQH